MEDNNELVAVHEWEPEPIEPILGPLIHKELEETK